MKFYEAIQDFGVERSPLVDQRDQGFIVQAEASRFQILARSIRV